MICTWGDTTDVTWWRELDLPTRALIRQTGRLREDVPEWIEAESGQEAYRQIAGLYPNQAQKRIEELLAESADLDGVPRPITHPVKFYENGDRPLEIVSSRQWYIRNGGRDQDLRSQFLKRGFELDWVPDFMKVRYEHWVNGLTGDWLVSRQRFFGVAIPVWYPVGADGTIDHDHPILPDEGNLPVDPTSATPPGYDEAQRGQPEGFIGDPDIMDTWATSSLTPQIAGHWDDDPDLFSRVFPMDLRPQGPEIIRTWLFSTVVRSHYEHDALPWAHTTINGWVLDPDRKKMSKSKGNVVTPHALIEEHGAEAVRYWACNGRPGTDTAVDHGVMKIGRRLATKILNASRFALGFADDVESSVITEALDRSMLATLAEVVEQATDAFDAFDYARALEIVERSFWTWTDDYVELVKSRAYDGGKRGRIGTCRPPDGPGGLPSALRPIPAVRDRRGLVLVAGGVGSQGTLARRRGAFGLLGRPCGPDRDRGSPLCGAEGQVGRQGLDAGRGGVGVGLGAGRSARPSSQSGRRSQSGSPSRRDHLLGG